MTDTYTNSLASILSSKGPTSINFTHTNIDECNHGGIRETLSSGSMSHVLRTPMLLEDMQAYCRQRNSDASYDYNSRLNLFYMYSRFLETTSLDASIISSEAIIVFMLGLSDYGHFDSIVSLIRETFTPASEGRKIFVCSLPYSSKFNTESLIYNVSGVATPIRSIDDINTDSKSGIILSFRGYPCKSTLRSPLSYSTTFIRHAVGELGSKFVRFMIPITVAEMGKFSEALFNVSKHSHLLGISSGRKSSILGACSIICTKYNILPKLYDNVSGALNFYDQRVRTMRAESGRCRDCELAYRYCRVKSEIRDHPILK